MPSCTLVLMEPSSELVGAMPGCWVSLTGRWGEISDGALIQGSSTGLGRFAVRVDGCAVSPGPIAPPTETASR